MKSGSAPQSPDYEKLIPLQEQSNLNQFNTMLGASRVNSSNPYGSQQWSKGADGTWSLTETLSPVQQQLLDSSQAGQLRTSQAIGGAADRVVGTMGQGLDTSGLPALSGQVQSRQLSAPSYQEDIAALLSGIRGQQASLDPGSFNQQGADAYYNQATRYLDPQVQQQTSAMEARLAEQGFVPGTPAYEQAMSNFRDNTARTYADARDRAVTGGFQLGGEMFDRSSSNLQSQIANILASGGFQRQQGMDANSVAQAMFDQDVRGATFGNQSRNQALAEALALRQLPFNEFASLRSGTQVQNPQLTAQYSTPNLQGVDHIGTATQDYQNKLGSYNAEVAGDNALLGGLFSLGGAALGAPWMGALLSGMGGGGSGTITGGSGIRFR